MTTLIVPLKVTPTTFKSTVEVPELYETPVATARIVSTKIASFDNL